MKKLFTFITIYCIFIIQIAYAFEYVTPEPKRYNMQNIATNFSYVKYKRGSIPTGSTSYIFELGTTTSSVVIGTLNTNSANYIKGIVPGLNTCEVYLDSAASQTLEISLIGIIR